MDPFREGIFVQMRVSPVQASMLPANRMTRCQAAGTRPAVLQLEASLNGEAHKQKVIPFGFQAAVAICWIVLTVALIGGDDLLLDKH